MHKNPDFITVAEKIFDERFSNAACGFIAGSIVRGESTPTSDIDLIILYDNDHQETYRDSIRAEGWPVELFIHNLKSQDYFFQEDIENGHCSTLNMIVEGHLIGSDTALGEQRKTIARSLIASGPKQWNKETIDRKRYFISDLWDDLQSPKDPDAFLFILSDFLPKLGEFHLRAKGQWSGTGKALTRLLKRDNPVFAAKFTEAFTLAATQRDLSKMDTLVQIILEPYGGYLFEGYKSVATDWKK